MTRQTLADDASVRDAIEALHDVRSVVDVEIFVWQAERERWRKLTLPERREMVEMAHALAYGRRRPRQPSGSGST